MPNELICDGNCKKELPFKIASQTGTLTLAPAQKGGKPTTVPNLEATIWNALTQVAQKKTGTAPNKRFLKVQCYCSDCWKKRPFATADLNTYKDARAKTNFEAINFQATSPCFLTPTGQPDRDRILSCLTHEIMHYWSARSATDQGLEALGRQLTNWDEFTTDTLGYEVYRQCWKQAPYYTPYDYLDKLAKFAGKLVSQQKDLQKKLQVLPNALLEDVKKGQLTDRKVMDVLLKVLLTWYFFGSKDVPEYGRKRDQFESDCKDFAAGAKFLLENTNQQDDKVYRQ